MRYHLFQKFFGKMVKIKQTSFLSTSGMILMFGNCIWSATLYTKLFKMRRNAFCKELYIENLFITN